MSTFSAIRPVCEGVSSIVVALIKNMKTGKKQFYYLQFWPLLQIKILVSLSMANTEATIIIALKHLQPSFISNIISA